MDTDLIRLVLSPAASPAWVAGVIGIIVFRRLVAFLERREDRRFVERMAEVFRDQIAGSIEGGRELRISTHPLGFDIGDLDSPTLGPEVAREGQ